LFAFSNVKHSPGQIGHLETPGRPLPHNPDWTAIEHATASPAV